MLRRSWLLTAAAPILRGADSEQQVFEVFTDLASALSEGNAGGFLDHFHSSMPRYEEFRAAVTGLVTQAEVASSIDFLRNEGNDAVRNVEVDWFLQIKQRHDTEAVTRRREIVKCRVEKAGRKWKVFTLEPQALFAPVTVTK